MAVVAPCASSRDSYCDDLGQNPPHGPALEESGPCFLPEASSPWTPSGAEQAPANVAGAGIWSNSGSLGHPIVCSRPCLYFPAGDCLNGDNCSFCHLPHPKRQPHLDKEHRVKLATMDPEAQRLWLLAVIRAKLLGLDASAKTQAIIEDLAQACGAQGLVLPEPTTVRGATRKFWTAMASLTLRALLVHLRKNLEELEPPTTFKVETVIKYCQSLAEASAVPPIYSF